jgi:hypothetical protein
MQTARFLIEHPRLPVQATPVRPEASPKPRAEQAMYIGPEVMMPLASAIAAIAGVLLMFWRRVVLAVRATHQAVGRTLSRLLTSR